MKYVLRTVLFHFICILFFGYIYMLSKSEFSSKEGTVDTFDCFFLSTTIQAGVGYTSITPITYFSKLIVMIQQFYMLSTNVFVLYFLTQL